MIIGVCGLMGSGKSVVMKYLRYLGYPVYDCDSSAKQMYYKPTVRAEVASLVGFDPIGNGGELRKVELSRILSESEGMKEALETIVHTAVKEDIEEWAGEYISEPYLFIESAIMYTSGICHLCDYVVAVEAPDDIRRFRVCQRDGDKDGHRFEQIQKLQEGEALSLIQADTRLLNDNKCSVILQVERLLTYLTGR